MSNKTANSIIELAKKAKSASHILSRLSTEAKNRALISIAEELEKHEEQILAANQKDLEQSKGKIGDSLYSRLKLNSEKLKEIVTGIRQVANLVDPIGKILLATELDQELELYQVASPIGVVGVIFESRPDALTQIASLCLKSSNAVILKGGSEAEKTNRVLFDIIRSTATKQGIPEETFVLLETREDINALLKASGYVDLIIPRGSNALVKYIQENTTIPVLGHADGICHIYIDELADPKKAVDISVDAKIQYPAACNAVETILVHQTIAPILLPTLIKALKATGVEVRVDEKSVNEFNLKEVKKATEEDWKTEYLDLIVSIKTVNSLSEAIEHINRYGSHHTDSIITESREAFDQFFAEVDSAGVFWNASTRFADGFRYGFGAEVGISTGKLHPRGPVGLEGLVTYKYRLLGNGQTVAMYSGPHAKKFTHHSIKLGGSLC